MSTQLKAGVFSAVNVIAALWVYRYLISGGWLTNHYHLNDPNLINLVLAIFEPIAVAQRFGLLDKGKTVYLSVALDLRGHSTIDWRRVRAVHSLLRPDLEAETDVGSASDYPPAIAPTTKKTSSPLTTGSGRGASGDS